jgi:nicotinic acid mononucleotide adenylyltransferase
VPQASSAQARYARAVLTLNDAKQAAHLAQAHDALTSAPHPDGRILAGGTLLDRALRVGLLAGSFNPLTRAHVALGAAAKAVGRLDAIVWTLTVVTVDKERVERASLVDRLLQMRALVDSGADALALINRGLYVAQAEVARWLLPHLDELVIVVGFDKIVQILDPRYYDDRDAVLDRLFGMVSLLVAPRSVEDEMSLHALIDLPENRRYRARIAFCPLPPRYRADSSSKARALAGEPGSDRQLRALLPPEGRTLAVTTGAYARDLEGGGEEASEAMRRADPYEARQAIISWLATLDPELLTRAPTLDSLVAARLDPSHEPDEVAKWLARAGWHSGPTEAG